MAPVFRPNSPQDDLWLWTFRDEGVFAGFTWRGRGDSNNFLPQAAGSAAAWRRLMDATGAAAMVHGEQVHGSQVALLAGGPLRSELTVPGVDGLATTVARVAVAVRVADCVPILVWAPGVVAAVHGGWRGLATGVLASGVRQLRRAGASPSALHAAVGPAIGPCCYQVGPDVAERLSNLPGGSEAIIKRDGAIFADLPSLAVAGLINLGVPADNISRVDMCTRCNPQLLFSYRRDGQAAGRQVGTVMLLQGREPPLTATETEAP